MNATGDPYAMSLRERLNRIHHKTLNRAHETGMLKIVTNFKTLNRVGCPIYSPWENILPLITLIFVALGILLFQGLVFGTLAFVLVMMIFVAIVRPLMASRLQTRAILYMLRSVDNWIRLWKIGGVAIIRTDRPSLGCVAPNGNWSAFVHEHLNDLSEDKQKEEEQQIAEDMVTEAIKEDIQAPSSDDVPSRTRRAGRRRRH